MQSLTHRADTHVCPETQGGTDGDREDDIDDFDEIIFTLSALEQSARRRQGDDLRDLGNTTMNPLFTTVTHRLEPVNNTTEHTPRVTAAEEVERAPATANVISATNPVAIGDETLVATSNANQTARSDQATAEGDTARQNDGDEHGKADEERESSTTGQDDTLAFLSAVTSPHGDDAGSNTSNVACDPAITGTENNNKTLPPPETLTSLNVNSRQQNVFLSVS